MLKPVIDSFNLLERADRVRFVLLVTARCVIQILDLVGLAAVGLVAALTASGIEQDGKSTFLGFSVSLESPRELLLLIVLTVLFFVAKSILASYLLRLTTKFLGRVESISAVKVMRSLFDGGLDRLSKVSEGEHVWISMNSSTIAFSTMLFAGSAVFSESLLFILILAAFMVVDPATATIIGAYFLVVVLLFQISVSRPLKRIGERLSDSHVKSNNAVLNLSAAFREISVAEKIDLYVASFAKSRTRYASEQMVQRFVMGLPRFFVEVALMVGFMGIVVWQFRQESLSEALVTTGVFLAGGLRMMASLLPLQNAIADIRTRGPEAKRAQTILREVKEIDQTAASRRPKSVSSARKLKRPLGIVVENLTYSYREDSGRALESIDMEINPGQFAAVVGPSGSGKTTLVDLMLGLREPTSGAVLVGGAPPHVARKLHPGSISYVPQRPGLTSGTIAQNVALAPDPTEVDPQEVRRALREAGLGGYLDSLPQGLATEIGPRLDGLSGGQLQRLGIARALYSRPKLLILDEATSALDADTEDEITGTLKSLSGLTTLVVIAHRLSTIQHADVVFVLEDGHLRAKGNFSEVRRMVPLIERYVQLMKVEDN